MDYPRNSFDKTPEPEKPEREKVKKVASGKVVEKKKKTLGARFVDLFSDISPKAIIESIVYDTVAPTLKDMFRDVLEQGFDRGVHTIFDSDRGRDTSSRNNDRYNTRYNDRYNSRHRSTRPPQGRRDERRTISRRGRENHDFSEIEFESSGDARDVLAEMLRRLKKHGVVPMSDLYELSDVDCDYTDEAWGWVDLEGARPQRTRNGWRLVLPPAELLEDEY